MIKLTNLYYSIDLEDYYFISQGSFIYNLRSIIINWRFLGRSHESIIHQSGEGLYPDLKLKKSQVLEYYIKVAPWMLGFLKNRVIVMNRYPDGIGKEGFYEKDAPAGVPSWVETFNLISETAQREIDYVVCNKLDTLIWMANLAALEINITLSTIDDYDSA